VRAFLFDLIACALRSYATNSVPLSCDFSVGDSPVFATDPWQLENGLWTHYASYNNVGQLLMKSVSLTGMEPRRSGLAARRRRLITQTWIFDAEER
jgi:hypothetical protein